MIAAYTCALRYSAQRFADWVADNAQLVTLAPFMFQQGSDSYIQFLSVSLADVWLAFFGTTVADRLGRFKNESHSDEK